MVKFVFSTVSGSLLDKIEGVPKAIRLFSFSDRTHKISLVQSSHRKNKIGTFDSTWIRIYDEENKYYDFITSSIFFITNSKGVIITCSEDTELLDTKYFAREINNFIKKDDLRKFSNDEYIDKYYQKISKEIKGALKELTEYYSLQKQLKSGRSNTEDLFFLSKNELSKKYLKDLILRNVIKENRFAILDLIK